MPKTIDAEILLPIATIKDKGLIYRGVYATEGLAWHFFPQSTTGFTQEGDYYRKQYDYRITDQTKVSYKVNGIRYNYSRYEAMHGGVYFYYASDGTEIFAAQGQIGGNVSLNIPVELGIPESLYYGEEQHTVYDYPMMINGKAPFGSSEDDAVWTVYINPIDEFGNVVEEEIEVLENQIWSEIEQMYN